MINFVRFYVWTKLTISFRFSNLIEYKFLNYVHVILWISSVCCYVPIFSSIYANLKFGVFSLYLFLVWIRVGQYYCFSQRNNCLFNWLDFFSFHFIKSWVWLFTLVYSFVWFFFLYYSLSMFCEVVSRRTLQGFCLFACFCFYVDT